MHFIGIGGVGMSGIAEILINLGFDVSGSDLRESENTRRLADLGAKIFIGHYTSNIEDYNVIVTSSAIDFSNPEIIEAKKRNIPIIHRSEMLAELVRLKHGIGVAGTHGKTTTSSILSHVLWAGNLNPTSIIGGKVFNFGSNAKKGEGDYLVFEADESDGSFLNLLPSIAIVTNIDADHLDHYKYFEGLKDAFLEYINNIPFYGYSVLCIDDLSIRELLPRIERPYFTYGTLEDADFRAAEIKQVGGNTEFLCYFRDELLGKATLPLLGKHNVLNSLAVIAVAIELEMSFEDICKGFASFKGVGRRLEYIGEKNNIRVIDDYGHHPTEVSATLQALKSLGRRLVVIFQPHRYSRTQMLAEDFGKSFYDADKLFLTEIYPAGETPIEGVNSQLIIDSIGKHNGLDVTLISRFEDISTTVASYLEPGDILVTLGAGDIYKVGKNILSEISE
jgi:UDP-N-acetylmuramate--alanine ligase